MVQRRSLPTVWVSLDRTKTKIRQLDGLHLEFIISMLEGIIQRRGANPYKKFRSTEYQYPHLGHEKLYLAVLKKEQKRRGL